MSSSKWNRRVVVRSLAVTPFLHPGLCSADSGGGGPLPKGFAKFKGPSDGFLEATAGGQRLIEIRSHISGGIVRYPIELPLEPGLRLQWNWRINTLPSAVAENTAATHDYSSVAVEFEDGRDLSWYWSSALKDGEHFLCPLPGWSTETHFVVGSGSSRLGKWVSVDRDITADAHVALNQMPSKVVAVWLIHMTVPQKGSASTDIRHINFVTPKGDKTVIFPA